MARISKKKAAAKKAPRGRPTKYKAEYDAIAEGMCKLGAIIPDLAAHFEVDPTTVDKWIAEKPSFSGAIKRGRVFSDAVVRDSLFKRANGYEFTEVKQEGIAGDGGAVVGTKVTKTTKHVSPDTTAGIFWLKNRQPKEWRDKQDVHHSGGISALTHIESEYVEP